MDDVTINKVKKEELEDEAKEDKVDAEDEEITEDDYGSASDGRSIIIMMAVIAGLFLLFLGGFKGYNYLTAGAVVTIDDLHKQNLEGELDDEKSYVYNGHSFVKADGLWWTETFRRGTLIKMPLHFGPKEVEDIKVEGKLSKDFNKNDDIFIAINPNIINKYYSLGLSELSFNVAQGINRRPVGACTEEDPDCVNRTIVSCNDTKGEAVIELVLDEKSGIELSGTCIKVSGQDYGIVKSVDRLLYRWYGIME